MRLKRIFAVSFVSALLCVLLPAADASAAGAGDVSGDGQVTAEDARLCLRQAVGLERYEKGSDAFAACDVTSDGDVTAEDARLILRAAVGLETLHVHVFGDWTPEKDETGARTGKHTRACACGVTETENCAYGERVAVDGRQTPTCTEDAILERTCTVCGGKTSERFPATGHSYGAWVKLNETQHRRVCANDGGHVETGNHAWNGGKVTAAPTCAAAGVKTYTCAVCKAAKTETLPATGHSYGAWTKLDETQHRRVCANDRAHVETEAHTWDGGKVTAAPTCAAAGVKTYTCAVCKATKTEPLPATGHSYGAWVKLDETQHRRVCANDGGHVETENHAWDGGKVTAAPTCAAAGVKTYTCAVCKAAKTETLPATGHSYGAWVKLDETQHRRVCANDRAHVETEAHTWDGGKVTAAPTCTAAGVKIYTCTACKATKRETLPAEHTFGEERMSVHQDKICERCGMTIPSFNTIVNSLKASDHTYTGFTESYNNGEVTQHKFHISLAAKAAAKLAGETLNEDMIVKQFSAEMTKPDHTYSDYAFKRRITDADFCRAGKHVVSDLTDADVQSMTVEETAGIDFLADLPDVVQVKSPYASAPLAFDLTEHIKAAAIGKVKKITVTLNEEAYADVNNKTEETALMRGMDQDLRALVRELNQSEDADGMKYEMKCDRAVSNGTITYYVDAETNQPIAAVYRMDVASAESFTMDMKLGGVSMMNGSMIIEMDSVRTNYYFFDSWFD